jgi:hypothetical protein
VRALRYLARPVRCALPLHLTTIKANYPYRLLSILLLRDLDDAILIGPSLHLPAWYGVRSMAKADFIR